MEKVHSTKVNYYFTEGTNHTVRFAHSLFITMFVVDDKQSPIDISIAGVKLTDPRIPKHPLMLSLLKYHSPSTGNEDIVDSSITPVTFTVRLDREQQIKQTDV